MAYQVTRSKVQLSPRRNSANSSLVAGLLPSLEPFFFSLGNGKLQVVCFWCWASGIFWRQSEGIDQGWLLKLLNCKSLFFDSLQAACCWWVSMSCKLGEAKGSGQERLLIFFNWAHPLPNVSHTMWQVADATGHAAQPNEAIACGIGCHVWERALDPKITSPWVNRCVSKFGTSPKSSIKMLDYLWNRNHRFLFLPPNFETHLLSADQSTQARNKRLFFGVQLATVHCVSSCHACCLPTIEPNNSLFTYEAIALLAPSVQEDTPPYGRSHMVIRHAIEEPQCYMFRCTVPYAYFLHVENHPIPCMILKRAATPTPTWNHLNRFLHDRWAKGTWTICWISWTLMDNFGFLCRCHWDALMACLVKHEISEVWEWSST